MSLSTLSFEELKVLPFEEQQKLFKKLDKIRSDAKTVNYSSLYKVGVEKLARTIKSKSKRDAKRLLTAFWERNWAVKRVEQETKIRTINIEGSRLRGKWLWNPVSKFYYSLRNEKDIFSTLNQGTGAFLFDCWLRNVLLKRKQLTGQFHDSAVLQVKKGNREKVVRLLKDSMEEVNESVKLKVKLDCDIKFGDNYGF